MKRILVVDDDFQVAELLVEVLAIDGHAADHAPNGRLALERLEADSYDLILTDMKMPELDGPGLYHAVQSRRPALARRFVFLTGDANAQNIQDFLDRTGAPTLQKPFRLDHALGVIRRALQEP